MLQSLRGFRFGVVHGVRLEAAWGMGWGFGFLFVGVEASVVWGFGLVWCLGLLSAGVSGFKGCLRL